MIFESLKSELLLFTVKYCILFLQQKYHFDIFKKLHK